MTRQGPASLPCPRCKGDTTLITRRGRPVRSEHGVLRGHKCFGCGHLFVSIQRIATDKDIEAIA